MNFFSDKINKFSGFWFLITHPIYVSFISLLLILLVLHVVDQPVHLSSHFTGYGILVSSDACIPMPCIQILSGHLQAPQHLAMFIVVGGTFPWVQFSPRTQPMQIFPCLFLMFCHYFFPLAYDVFSLFSFSISLSLSFFWSFSAILILWCPILFILSVILDRLGDKREYFALHKGTSYFATGIAWWWHMGCNNWLFCTQMASWRT